MPLELELIRATEFVRVGAEGRFDLAASKKALAAIVSACRKRGLRHAVMDLRGVRIGPKSAFTTADLVELVNTFPKAGFTHELRVALIYASDPHKRARLFAFLSTLHGWEVQAFGNFEEAVMWLSSNGVKVKAAEQEKKERVPIRFHRPSQVQARPELARPGSARVEWVRPSHR